MRMRKRGHRPRELSIGVDTDKRRGNTLKVLITPVFSAMVLFALLTACAVRPQLLTADLSPIENLESRILARELDLEAPPAKRVRLRRGTTWIPVGEIAQGVVYRSNDQILMAEAFNSSEAYLVIEGESVVGYFLPFEHGFVPVRPAVIRFTNP
jgi:hypothetical protein